ncbi:hypothetical protein V3F60_004063 [Salmonella enterica]
MNGEIIFPSGKSGIKKGQLDLSINESGVDKQVGTESKKVVLFVFGGAADAEPYYTEGPNWNCAPIYNKVVDEYTYNTKLGVFIHKYYAYNMAKGDSDIKIIKDLIPDRETSVYIIGHSLGGWNGAHLSQILTDDGYNIAMLVTLDPVGEGFLVWLGSDIYFSEPEPKAKKWINIRAAPSSPDGSDDVADFGERWIVTSGPNVNETIDENHRFADRIFFKELSDKKSAFDHVKESIDSLL